MASIPTFGFTLEEFTPQWVTELARASNWITEQQTVESFEITKLEDIGYKAIVYLVQLQYSSEPKEGAAKSFILKLAKLIDGVANQLTKKFFLQEIRFYEHLQQHPLPEGVRVPGYYFGHYSEDGKFVLIVENLMYGSGRNGNQSKGIELSHTRELLRQLALVHAQWWEAPALSIDWISVASSAFLSYCTFFVNNWANFLADVNSGRYQYITPNFVQAGEYLAEELKNYSMAKYIRGKKTLSHGDMRGGNIMVWDKGEREYLSLIDFQCVHPGNAGEDVGYFLGGSITEEDYIAHEDELLHYYFDELLKNGVKDFTWDEFMGDYQQQLVLNLVCTVISMEKRKLGLKMNPGAPYPTQVDVFLEGWLKRSALAIERHLPNAAEFIRSRWAPISHTPNA